MPTSCKAATADQGMQQQAAAVGGAAAWPEADSVTGAVPVSGLSLCLSVTVLNSAWLLALPWACMLGLFQIMHAFPALLPVMACAPR